MYRHGIRKTVYAKLHTFVTYILKLLSWRRSADKVIKHSFVGNIVLNIISLSTFFNFERERI